MGPKPIVWVAVGAIVVGATVVLVLTWPAGPPRQGPVLRLAARLPGASAREVEHLVAIPLEAALAPVPGIEALRSVSVNGRAVLRADIEDENAVYRIRRQVAGILARARSALPDEARVSLGPSGRSGFRYSLTGDRLSTGALQRLHESLRRKLLSIPGAEAVLECLGARREIEVVLDPRRLSAYGAGLEDVRRALDRPTRDPGRGPTSRPSHGARMRRGPAGPRTLGATVVARRGELAVRLRDVATIRETVPHSGCYCLHGTASLGVCGLLMVAPGADRWKVVRGLEGHLASMAATLPAGTTMAMFGSPTDPHPLQRLRVRLPRGVAPASTARTLAGRLKRVPGLRDFQLEWGLPRFGELDHQANEIDVLLRVAGPGEDGVRGLRRRVDAALSQVPGISHRYLDPDLPVLRVMGPDLGRLVALARQAQAVARRIEGVSVAVLVGAERHKAIRAQPSRTRLAAQGLALATFRRYVQATRTGIVAAHLGAGPSDIPLRLRLGRGPGAILGVTLPAPGGGTVRLVDLATLVEENDPAVIRRLGGRRFLSLHFRFSSGHQKRARDAIDARIRAELRPPAGYSLVWSQAR